MTVYKEAGVSSHLSGSTSMPWCPAPGAEQTPSGGYQLILAMRASLPHILCRELHISCISCRRGVLKERGDRGGRPGLKAKKKGPLTHDISGIEGPIRSVLSSS